MPGSARFEFHRPWRVGTLRVVVFDFDGTLSLLREGWPAIMREMMTGLLRAASPDEAEERLRELAEDLVVRLNGQPTIQQFSHLNEEVQRRGGQPRPPEEHKEEYLRRLMAVVEPRRQALASGAVPPAAWAVAGSHAFLEQLQSRGLRLVLASGTDVADVRKEAELLDLTRFFAPGDLHGAQPDGSFTKPRLFRQLVDEMRLQPGELLGIGDGVVETAVVKELGGVAIGLCSDFEQPGRINPWKRPQLVQAGADLLIPDYGESEQLLSLMSRTN